jgi:CRISPR-associated protein Cas1
MEKGCFVLKDKDGNKERFPLFEKEIGEVVLKSGNAVSTGALASMGFWGIDVLVTTQRGRPVAMLRSLDDDSHVATRIAQYEALNNGKGIQIAKQLVLSKIDGQNWVLNKYGLRIPNMNIRQKVESLVSDNLKDARQRLTSFEGKMSEVYLREIFKLIPEKLRPTERKAFQAYDGINNIFNLAYEILSWKVHRALVNAKLEPYLGFLHSLQEGKPSLVCDFEELYRYLMDDFVIQYCQTLKKKDFYVKTEALSRKKLGKREYLSDSQTTELMKSLNRFFETMVEVPRIRVGKRQTIETLINEEALSFAQFLREEKTTWAPKIVHFDTMPNYTFKNLKQ